MKEVFSSPKGFIGKGVAQVCIADGRAYISGQVSCDLETGAPVHDSMAAQTERVILALQGIMEDLGGTLDDIVKCNVFLSSMDLFDEMNEVYIKYFGLENPPARQTVTAGVWDQLDIEISAEAVISQNKI